MFAPHQWKPPTAVGAAQGCVSLGARRASEISLRHFSFGNFSFCASGFKKKSGVPSWVSKICRRVKVTFILDVLSFGTRGAKERTKENADAPAGARVRYFLKKVAQKLLSTGLCEHGALPYAEKRRCLADVFRSAIKYVRTIINS